MNDAATDNRSIHARINAVMKKVQYADKTRANTHMKYKFIGHEDVTMALREAMVEEGIIQLVTVEECLREGSSVRVKVGISWVGPDGLGVTVGAWGESFSVNKAGTPDDVQVGKAVSYAVKTAQLKNFMLIGDTTPDAEETHGREAPQAKPADADAETDAIECISAYENCDADTFASITKTVERIAPKVTKKTLALLNTAYMSAEKRLGL